jgi:hypothetical protein
MEDTMRIVNLTPHPMHLFGPSTPDRIEPGTVPATQVIPPSQDPPAARLGHTVFGAEDLGIGVTVERVAFGPDNGQPSLPEPVEGIWYLVSLVVGLAATGRSDLLVPHEYVRDLDGAVVGCRKLARPHHR